MECEYQEDCQGWDISEPGGKALLPEREEDRTWDRRDISLQQKGLP